MNRCETITTEERDKKEEMKNSYEQVNRCETITTEERDKKEEMKNSYEQVRDYNNRGERQKGRDEKLL